MKKHFRTRTRRTTTALIVAAINITLGGLFLLAPAAPASADSPPPFHQHVATKGPIVPTPKPSGPVPAPTADIASPQKHQLPPPEIGTTTSGNGITVDLKILVLAADGNEADLGAIRQILNYLGTPYQVFQAAPVPASPSTDRLRTMLSDGGTHGNFQAVILTTGTLGYTSGGSFISALTTTEWTTLYTYEAKFSVRQVSWYTYPTPDYGFAGSPTSSSAAVAGTFTAGGQTIFGSYANTATPLNISNVFLYLTPPAADGKTTTLLTNGANALAVTHTYPDNRENLALTFDSNQYLTHDLVLAYGLVNWATKGLFLGERHSFQLAQPDDFFIADNTWTPPPAATCATQPTTPATYRINNADLTAFVTWQNSTRSHATTAQNRVEIPFNGVGTLPGYVSGESSPTLVQSAITNKNQFNWMSHTYDHADLNSATTAQSDMEIVNNLTVATTTLALTTFSPDAIVTPGVTGLANPQFLQSAVSHGIKYAVTDASLPQYTNPSPNAGIYNPIQSSILMIPRHASNLYYNVSTPGEWLAEDNCLYPAGMFGHVTTNAQLLDRESSQLLSYLLSGDIDPLMFHQSNMRAYDGVHSLLSDLMDATYAKYNAVFTLPIINLTTDGIGVRMANRMQYNAAQVTGSMTLSATGISSVTINTQGATKAPITGLPFTCTGCTTENYGGQTITTMSLTAGQSISLFANVAVTTVEPNGSALAGGGTVTIRGAGFQPGSTVKIGANACTAVTIADSATIRCTVPTATTAATVDVTVVTGGQTAILHNAFTYGPVGTLPGAKPPGGITAGSQPSSLPLGRAPAGPAGTTGIAPSPLPSSR